MGLLLIEFPYICEICKTMAKKHNYQRLIKILKLVIDRHSKTVKNMELDELNIFMQILIELVTLIHSESTIPLNQNFESSVIYKYIEMIELIINHQILSKLIKNKLKIKSFSLIINIYFSYSRFKKCEKIIDSAIALCCNQNEFGELIKLIIIKSCYITFICCDIGDNNRELVSKLKNNLYDTFSANNINMSQLPTKYSIFLKLLQIDIRIRFDECLKAAKILQIVNNQLIKLINNDKIDNNHKYIGKKRKFQDDDVINNNAQPAKKQRLNDNSVVNISNSNNNNGISVSHDAIVDDDIIFLINYCSVLNLCWIIRNASFTHKRLDDIRLNTKFLSKYRKNNDSDSETETDTDVDTDIADGVHANDKDDLDIDNIRGLSFFEKEIMKFFQNRSNQSLLSCDEKELTEFTNKINSNLFENTFIPLLKRIKKLKNRNNNDDRLTDHVDWFKCLTNLNVIIYNLYYCFKNMHLGSMNTASEYCEIISNTLAKINDNNQTDFGLLNLRFLIWSISTHLSLIKHNTINDNINDIHSMIVSNDTIIALLSTKYCKQELFQNYIVSQSSNSNKKTKHKSNKNKNKVDFKSKIKIYNDIPLILFEAKIDLPSLKGYDVNNDDDNNDNDQDNWLKSVINSLKSGEILHIHSFKSYLRMVGIKLHYLSSHVALILQDKKCTRNQVKRVHRLTLKSTDGSSRFYIRLMLEILRHNNNNFNKLELNKQIKSIYDYIKMLFVNNNLQNTISILPFVALCAIYTYCTFDDHILRAFTATTKTKKNNINPNTNQNPAANQVVDKIAIIRNRIIFLKYILRQLLKQRMQGSYIHIMLTSFIYLYKLMKQYKNECNNNNNEFETDLKQLKILLISWISSEWKFIKQEFNECNSIKRSIIRAIISLKDDNDDIEMKNISSVIDNDELIKFNENNNFEPDYDESLRKICVNWFDHLYIHKK